MRISALALSLSCFFVAGPARAEPGADPARPLLEQASEQLMTLKGGKAVALGQELSKASGRVSSGNSAELGEPPLKTSDFNTAATVLAHKVRMHVAELGPGGITNIRFEFGGYQGRVLGGGTKAKLAITDRDGTTAHFEASLRGAEPPRRTWVQHERVEGNRRLHLSLSASGRLSIKQEVASANAVRVVEREFRGGARTFSQVSYEKGAIGDEFRPQTASWSHLVGSEPRKSLRVGGSIVSAASKLPGVRKDGVRVRAKR